MNVTRPEYWLRQVLEPVRFAAGMTTLEREHVTACIEIGPQPDIARDGTAVRIRRLRDRMAAVTAQGFR